MKLETKIRTFGLSLTLMSVSYFGCYVLDNDYNAFNSPGIEIDQVHYHNGIKCLYEGLECPILSNLTVKY